MKRRPVSASQQRGVLLVLFALLLPAVLGMAGLALDLARLYQRRGELQNLADSAALAAARSLDGTAAGVAAAAASAAGIAVEHWNNEGDAQWQPAALTFGADPDAPDGAWLDAAAAALAPAALRYAKVDTRQLQDGRGALPATLSRLLGAGGALQAAARAVAGRATLPVTPLAICAMGADTGVRNNPGASAAGGLSEQLRFGFRFGVAYNLLSMNYAENTTVPEYFLVDPVQPANAAQPAVQEHTADSVLAPYVCSGSVQLGRVAGAALRLRRPAAFNLAEQLNSRFGQYGAGAQACSADGAPPDTNIRQYAGAAAGWMSPLPSGASATPAPAQAGQRYNTMADRAKALNNTDFGPLWAYGPAKRSAGGDIGRDQWAFLYPATNPGLPVTAAAATQPPPYLRTLGAHFQAPAIPGTARRRVLTVPLIDCSAIAGGAVTEGTVLALAQFLMVAQASGAAVSAEFAGLVSERELAGPVELYQ